MQDSTVQESTPPATGTTSDTPLKTPVAEKFGQLDEAKLAALIRGSLMSEPSEQETSKPAKSDKTDEETTEEITSEESPVNTEPTEDKKDLSQDVEDADNSESDDGSEEEIHELPKGVKKKLSKLSAAKRELEEKLKTLESETVALKQRLESNPVTQPAIAPVPGNPYLHLDTQSAVEAEIAQARRVRRWAEENPDGTTITDQQGQEKEYSSEDIRRIRLNAVDALEEHLPRQLQYVHTRTQLEPQVDSTYNWWKDKTSREYNQAQNILQVFPEVRKFPDYKLFIGDYMKGAQVREADYSKQKQAATKAVVKKAPSQPNKPASAPAPISKDSARSQEASAAMRKSPSQESLKKVLLSSFL